MSKIQVAGEDYTTRLKDQIRNESLRYAYTSPLPTDEQVAMVLHALADHTAIMYALQHRPDETSPWPEATSIGRFLHDVGDEMEDLQS